MGQPNKEVEQRGSHIGMKIESKGGSRVHFQGRVRDDEEDE